MRLTRDPQQHLTIALNTPRADRDTLTAALLAISTPGAHITRVTNHPSGLAAHTTARNRPALDNLTLVIRATATRLSTPDASTSTVGATRDSEIPAPLRVRVGFITGNDTTGHTWTPVDDHEPIPTTSSLPPTTWTTPPFPAPHATPDLALTPRQAAHITMHLNANGNGNATIPLDQ